MHHTEQTNWGLERSPFSSGLETRLFFEGASHREALARLRFLLANRRLGLLFGEPGTGKSLLLKVFENECRRHGCAVASVNLLGLSTREFYWQVASQLATAVCVEDDQLRLFRQLSDRIVVNQLQGVPTVVLVDDAHQAGPDLLAQLVRLTQLDAASPRPLTMVLAARESHSGRLGEQLLELVDLRIDLEPWDELDTTGYLQLAQVEGGCQQPLFDDEALAEIHRLAEGVPRRVNRLADYALLVGASAESEIINAETIRAAHEALSPPVRA
jgi:type II secretory pathway predicted ATPase ExeA